jgi:hypothetical protein
MFKLTKATVHYGTSSYDLHGLPERFNELNSIDDLDLADLTATVGQLTSFTREFTARHCERMEFVGIKDAEGNDLVNPEHIFASANGYSIRWDRVQCDCGRGPVAWIGAVGCLECCRERTAEAIENGEGPNEGCAEWDGHEEPDHRDVALDTEGFSF